MTYIPRSKHLPPVYTDQDKNPEYIRRSFAKYIGAVYPQLESDPRYKSQYFALRRTYYAGAGELLAIILTMLDPGEEPTDKDLKNMSFLQFELDQFLEAVRSGEK